MEVSGGPNNNDVLFQASIGYVDQQEIDWNVDYKFAEEAGLEGHTFVVFITKAIVFSTQ